MIKVTFHKMGDKYIGFDVEGHADFEDGVDRVCTAVSVLTTHTVKSITERFKNMGSYERRKGFLIFRVKEIDDERSNDFIGALFDSLKDLENRFPSNIRVEVMDDGT